MKTSSLKWLLPLLLFYFVAIWMLQSPGLEGDESRHLRYAQNLLKGYYTTAENPRLEQGPGYIFAIVPFLFLQLPLLYAKLLNGIFVFMGIVWFYLALRDFQISHRRALLASYFMGLYIPLIKWSSTLYSEALAFCLICGLIYYFNRFLRKEQHHWGNYLGAAFMLGFLTLTKVIFGHVIIVALLLSGIGYLFFSAKKKFLRSGIVLLGGYLVFSPFLLYSYSLTGKAFYSGTGGGEIFYFRTAPYANEYGSWFSPADIYVDESEKGSSRRIHADLSDLIKNHKPYFDEIKDLSYVERDSAFMATAIENIANHPKAYLKNTFVNFGRLLFNYPFSYRYERLSTYGYLIPNMFIVVLLVLAILPGVYAWRRLPFELMALCLFFLIYMGGVTALLGIGRYFILLVPVFLLFIAYVFSKIVEIKISKNLSN